MLSRRGGFNYEELGFKVSFKIMCLYVVWLLRFFDIFGMIKNEYIGY